MQAEGGAMLYGRGGFQASDVLPGQEQLDQGGALRFVVGEGAYAAEYDANGNMTSRVVAGQAQVLEWDAENRLVAVRQGASVSTSVYDGDGNRVQATVDGVTTVYIGGYYEETAGTVRTYYYHNGQRVAMREAGVTTWLVGDHLGSTSVAYRESDGQTTGQRYYAWGTIRPGPENELPTDYTFTGQRLAESAGLMYYGARWYDPCVGRFLSADSIVPVPGDPQSLNRFAYVRNNPVANTDPSGHMWANEDYDTRRVSYSPSQAVPEPRPLYGGTVAAKRGDSLVCIQSTPTQPSPSTQRGVTSYMDNERALARMMWGEQKGTWPEEERMIAVGFVAIHRLDAGWSDTLITVLSAPNQFKGYRPDDPAETDREYGSFLTALVCARTVLDGTAIDRYKGTFFAGDAYWRDEADTVYTRVMSHSEQDPGFQYFLIPTELEAQRHPWGGKLLVLTNMDYTSYPRRQDQQ